MKKIKTNLVGTTVFQRDTSDLQKGNFFVELEKLMNKYKVSWVNLCWEKRFTHRKLKG